jgi:hypothetical protein
MTLRDQFSSGSSFALFATALASYEEYRQSFDAGCLTEAESTLIEAVTRYPRDPLHHYQLALVKLELVTATDADAAGPVPQTPPGIFDADLCYADPEARRLRDWGIDAAIGHLRLYRELRVVTQANRPGLDLWSDYALAAAELQRLTPGGYKAVQGLLRRHVDVPDAAGLDHPEGSASTASSRGEAEPGLWRAVGRWFTLRRFARALGPLVPEEHDGAGLRLQAESLFHLSRIRPLREAESMRSFAASHGDIDLGTEGVRSLEWSLSRWRERVQEAHAHAAIRDATYWDLVSDGCSQLGHLYCAHALRASGWTPSRVVLTWPDAGRPIDNGKAFAFMCLEAGSEARAALRAAERSFREAAVTQPRWRPAQQNLAIVATALRGIASTAGPEAAELPTPYS